MRRTVLLAPQLLADGIGHDLVPVDLGSRHWQLSSKRLRESMNVRQGCGVNSVLLLTLDDPIPAIRN
jgi:hypothetical protein